MTTRPDRLNVLLHSGTFAAVAIVLWIFLAGMLTPLDPVTRSVTSSLVAGLAANLVITRKLASGTLADFGLNWTPSSARHALYGLLLGGGSFGAIVGGAMAAGWANWEPAPAGNLLWIAAALLAGAAGEELLFRGYGFQFLANTWPTATVAASGALFGLTHLLLNAHIQAIGTLNTALWGALLGYAYCRTRSLWLPIGVHYGWNLATVLLGANLSGTTIEATGVQLRWSADELWSGGAYGPEGGLLATAAGVAVLLIVRRVR